MHPPVSAERWAALRALREGEPPTFPRLAAAANLNPATVRERALRDDWKKQNYPRHGSKAARRGSMALVGLHGEGAADCGTPGLAEPGQEMSLAELRQRLADVLPRQLGEIITLAERGVLDKARIDALVSIGRVLERSETLAGEPAEEKQKRSDDELAAMLGRIDGRIEELARAYAEQLVEAKHREGAG